jgi:hypothetical protein
VESVIAQQFEQFRKSKDNSIGFQPVNDDDRQQFGRLGREVQTHRQRRQQLEAKAIDPSATPSAPSGPSARVKLPKSPFVARRPEEFGEKQRPPPTHVRPQLDSKLVPQPRGRESPRADAKQAAPKVKGAPKASPKFKPKDNPQAAPPKEKPKVKPKAAPPKEKPKAAPRNDKPKSKPRAAPKVKPKAAPRKDKPKSKPKSKSKP